MLALTLTLRVNTAKERKEEYMDLRSIELRRQILSVRDTTRRVCLFSAQVNQSPFVEVFVPIRQSYCTVYSINYRSIDNSKVSKVKKSVFYGIVPLSLYCSTRGIPVLNIDSSLHTSFLPLNVKNSIMFFVCLGLRRRKLRFNIAQYCQRIYIGY